MQDIPQVHLVYEESDLWFRVDSFYMGTWALSIGQQPNGGGGRCKMLFCIRYLQQGYGFPEGLRIWRGIWLQFHGSFGAEGLGRSSRVSCEVLSFCWLRAVTQGKTLNLKALSTLSALAIGLHHSLV